MCMMCRNGGNREAVLDEVVKNLVAYVPVGGADDGRGGGFVYTIGLTALDMPELLVDRRSRAGVDSLGHGNELVQHAFLKPVAEWAMRRKSLTSDDRMLPVDYDAPVWHEVVFEEIDPSPLRVARAFYHRPVQAMRACKQALVES